MTQDDLAAATGYSRALIGALEQNRRLPDLAIVTQRYLPALGLQDEPLLASQLITLAAFARGEHPPPALLRKDEQRFVLATATVEEPHRLPLPPTALLGRDQAIKELVNRLLGHHGRLLTLIGPPGVGKTRLAQAVGAEVQLIYRDGALFVPLAAVTDPTLVAATLITALKLPDSSNKTPPARLIEYLRRKELLLILDNFEQIIAAAPLLAELLAECAGLRILVTSRERLHLRAEQRYNVPPLALPAAVELFVHRAQAVNADFRLTTPNQPTLAAICERLDRLPLALELCAAQIDLFAPAQLLAELQSRSIALLVNGAQDLPPHQRTLRHAIARSYQLLTDDQRRLFRSLGVFGSGFDLAAVVALHDGPVETQPSALLATLHALISKCLVYSEPLAAGEQRFGLLATIRAFALEQLTVHNEMALLRKRHFSTYLALVRTADRQLRGAGAATWYTKLDHELDNVRTAWEWALSTEHWLEAAWLGVAISHYWNVRTYYHEATFWLEQLLPHRQALPHELRLATLLTLYHAWRGRDDFRSIDRYMAELVQLQEASANKGLQAIAYRCMGVATADFAHAVTHWAQCIALLREVSNEPDLGSVGDDGYCVYSDGAYQLAFALFRYAIRLTDGGDYAAAERLSSESLAIFRRRGNRDFIVYPLGNLGRLALLRGDLVQARLLLQEAIATARSMSNSMGLLDWLPRLAVVMLYGGDVAEARRLLDESLRICLTVNSAMYLAWNYTYLAETALWQGDHDQAAQWLAQALTYHANPRWVRTELVDCLWVAARLATAQQQYQRAATLFGLVEQVGQRIRYAPVEPVQSLVNAALATVQAALEPAAFAEAFAAGQQMTLAEASVTLQSPLN